MRMIQAADAELCTETFGDRNDPPVLLVMGMGASMVWWEDGFCERLAAGGRHVIRYDHRDTGLSTAYPPGEPGYGPGQLIADAVAVLDGYGIDSAHVGGLSMGGALAQLVALRHPERVASLTLITTSPAATVDYELPGPAPAYGRFLAAAHVDWSDPQSLIEHLVEHWRALGGSERPFDAGRIRALATADVRRARRFSSAQNHALLVGDAPPGLALSSIAVPTLVISGSADPLFAPAHGRALAETIPGARLLELPGAGHGLAPADWDVVVPAMHQHTDG